MAISEETAGHRATLRVLAILDALAASQKGLTMAEICRELGAPKSSLFPILHTMADTEYIDRAARLSAGQGFRPRRDGTAAHRGRDEARGRNLQ